MFCDWQNRNIQDELTYNNQLRESDGANQMSRTMTEDMPKFSDEDKVVAKMPVESNLNLINCAGSALFQSE